MNILLIGAPGSGKGTQAEKLINEHGYRQVSTGDLLRAQIAKKTTLGLEAQKYMDDGKLVPDDVVNGMVKEFLSQYNDKLIFDGYPRTIVQAKAVDEMLIEVSKKIDYVVYLDLDFSVLMDRITGRIVCPLCKVSYHKTTRKPKVDGICDNDQTPLVVRADDAPEKVSVRLNEYNTLTAPLIEFYSDRLVHLKDLTNATPDEVYEKIVKALNINDNN